MMLYSERGGDVMAIILSVMIAILAILLVIGVPISFTFALSGIVGGLMAGFPIGTIASSPIMHWLLFPSLPSRFLYLLAR